MRDREFLPSDDRTACFFCGCEPAVWARRITGDLIDADGRGYMLGGPLTLCDACEALFETGAMAELLSTARRSQPEAYVRSTGASLAAATGPAYRLEHFDEEPQVVALIADGFVDLDRLTGAVDELRRAWPPEHYVRVRDERPNRWPDDVDRHLVRSPWPDISVRDVLGALWRWVERDDAGLDNDVRMDRIREVFGWTADEMLRALR